MTLTQQVARNAEALGHKIPHVRCPCCHEGMIPLEVHLLVTWQSLSDKPQTVDELAGATKSTKAATVSRLNRLAALGLARMSGYRPRPLGIQGGRQAGEWVRVELPMEGPR